MHDRILPGLTDGDSRLNMDLSTILSIAALVVSILALAISLIRHFEDIATANYWTILGFTAGLALLVTGFVFIIVSAWATFLLGFSDYLNWLLDLNNYGIFAALQSRTWQYPGSFSPHFQLACVAFVAYIAPIIWIMIGVVTIENATKTYRAQDEEE